MKKKHKITLLERRVYELEKQVEMYESLRPHWSQGFSSDSIAAQVQTTALSQIWGILGVKNQSEAMGVLCHLLKEETKS